MRITFVNPGDRRQVFQSLGIAVAAIEPPFWIAVLAAYLRNQGHAVAVVDANAENLAPAETAGRVAAQNPHLAVIVVYGSQPSASTQNMTAALAIAAAIKEQAPGAQLAMGGLHPSALPAQTLRESACDCVIDGEGPLTLTALLAELAGGRPDWSRVPGLWWRDPQAPGGLRHTPRAPLIQNLDDFLPVGAWDLLPMSLYRAHNWHCFDHLDRRQPYGAIYTSLGCPFNCVFCCINAPFGKPAIRYRSPGRVLDEMALLAGTYGIYNLKIVDELFILKPEHYLPILQGIIDRGLRLNMWVYARVDTIRPEHLPLMKRAGANWVALCIESANPAVRDGASKNMRARDIKAVVRQIQDAGIRVIGNYIFGLPDDTLATMRETLDLALDLNCEFANFYCAMAYPGSRLYSLAVEEHWQLPDCWHAFSQHAYNARPLPTRHLSAAAVLRFRDDAFHAYFSHPPYLAMVGEKFGAPVREHIADCAQTRLRRQLLEAPSAPC